MAAASSSAGTEGEAAVSSAASAAGGSGGGGGGGEARYLKLVRAVAEAGGGRFQVELDDVQLHDPALVSAVVANTRRYTELFSEAIDELMPPPTRSVSGLGGHGNVHEMLQMARIARLDANPDVAGGAPLTNEALRQIFPKKLLRQYEVRFTPLSAAAAKPQRLRDIGAHAMGKFVTAECMVIRASDVKPLIEVAVYACDVCGYETYQELVGKSFSPLTECISESCRMNKTPGAIRMQVRQR